MNAPRIVSMTALAASLLFVVFAITQVNGGQPVPADLSASVQFCQEATALEADCSTISPVQAAIR